MDINQIKLGNKIENIKSSIEYDPKEMEILLKTSSVAKELEDDIFAQNFYAALCNIEYHRIDNPLHTFGCSWRYAGGLIAEIRNKIDETAKRQENYLDYYCSFSLSDNPDYMSEGILTDRVREAIKSIGYIPFESNVLSNQGRYHEAHIEFVKENEIHIDFFYNINKDLQIKNKMIEKLKKYCEDYEKDNSDQNH